MQRKGTYLTISEASRVLGVSPSSLRNWEQIGLITPFRSQGRYRLYPPDVVRQAKRIQYLRQVKRLNPEAILHMMGANGGGAQKRAAATRSGANIGARLMRLRRQRGLTLGRAAQKAGISTSFLSAIERNRANPSVATFQKLAQLYNTNVVSFFGGTPDGAKRLVRPKDRKVLQPQPGIRIESLAFGETMMETQLWHIAPGAGSGGSYHHEGEEFIFVLKGTLEIWLDEIERYVVGPGDSLYFPSSHAHSWRNQGKEETVMLWVNTPPTF